MKAFEQLWHRLDSALQSALERPLEGRDLDEDQVVLLFAMNASQLPALLAAADTLRQETVGDQVTYVVNRNINFTNVCIKRCGFCAFSRAARSEQGYWLPIPEIVRRAAEAWEWGATEVCIQAGLPPEMEGDLYLRICEAVKAALPGLHIHAFSPEEVLYGSRCSGRTLGDYLQALKSAGVGSLPGTSAEILDDRIRHRISPGRISTRKWIEVISTAHSLGIPTTSTIMYGHLETDRDRARHLILLRDLQRRSGGFTEFVPLSFVHTEAPMFREGSLPAVRPGATGQEVLKMHAIARLVLNRDIPNIQVSWVKEGFKMAQACLSAGANDLGGTLINESISTSAGALHGQMARPLDLRRLIWDSGRVPAERSTLYRLLRRFESEKSGSLDPLDGIQQRQAQRFGSYQELAGAAEYRYRGRQEPAGEGGPSPE